MGDPIEDVVRMHCITGGVWKCDVYDSDFPDDPLPFFVRSVELCNVGKVKNDNDDITLIFNQPITCDIESNELNCGCPR